MYYHCQECKVYYREEEPGCDVYYTNDDTGNYFPERYFLDCYEEPQYWRTIEEAAKQTSQNAKTILTQAKNGVYVRMAIMDMILRILLRVIIIQ